MDLLFATPLFCKCGGGWSIVHTHTTNTYQLRCVCCGVRAPESDTKEGAKANWEALQLILSE